MRFLVLSSLLLGACGGGGGATSIPGDFKPTGEKLLTVDGKYDITQDMVDAVTRLTPEAEIESLKQSGSYSTMVEQIGLGEVLYREALKENLHKDPAIQKALMMKEREALAQELLSKRVESRITPEAVQRLYDERGVQYKRPQARARHILVQEEALASEIMKKLSEGADFADLAKEFTIDARTRGEGGDLGWFQRDKLIEEVAAVAFDGEIGQPQGPVETRFGFHIIEPIERRDAIPLDEVRGELENELRKKEYGAVIEEVRAGLAYERFGEVKEIHDKTSAWGANGPAMPHPPGDH